MMIDQLERRLDEDASPLERALLQEGRAYRASEGLRASTLAGLGLTATAGSAVSGMAWLSARSWTAKLLLALSSVTLLLGIPIGYLALSVGKPSAPSVSPVPAAVSLSVPVEQTNPVEQTDPGTLHAVAAPTPPQATDSPSPVGSVPVRATTGGSSALRAELAALDAVRSTLANQNPAGALSLLAVYFRNFPRGRLRFEADVLRIDALAKAGQTGVAQQHAREFLRRHPNSVLTARVRPYAEP
jgi:hypothetical protein